MGLLQNRRVKQIQFDTMTDEQMRNQLLTSKRRLLPEVTDENKASVIMRIIDYFVKFSMRWLRAFLNYVANQTFLSKATLYDAHYERAVAFGYHPEQEAPATGKIVVTLLQDLPYGLFILRSNRRFLTKRVGLTDPVTFELLNEQEIIPAGSLTGDKFYFDIVQGESFSEVVDTSSGEIFQEYEVSQGYVIEGSQRVYVEETYYDDEDNLVTGYVEWTQARNNNLLYETFDARCYEVLRFTENGHIVIGFGNGVDDDTTTHGMIPPIDANVKITGRKLIGGQNGNVAVDSIVRTSPASAYFEVTNEEATDGWTEREAIEHSRWSAMRFHRVGEYLNNLESYEIMAERNVTGVGRVYVVAREFGENTMVAHVIDSDGDPADQDVCDTVSAYIESINPHDEIIKSKPATLTGVDISGALRVKDGFDFDDVKADVEEALETNFDPIAYDASGNRYFDAGGTVHPDDIRRIVLAVEGVAWFTISSPAIALALDSFELPILGTVTITEG